MEDYRKYLNKPAYEWNREQLAKAVSRLGTALENVTNREIKKFGYKNIEAYLADTNEFKRTLSPGLSGIIYTRENVYGGSYKTTDDLERNALLAKYNYINNAYQYRTLRYKGYQEWVEEEKQVAKDVFGKSVDEDRIATYWEIYHSFFIQNPNARLPDRYESVRKSVVRVLEAFPDFNIRATTKEELEKTNHEKQKILKILKTYVEEELEEFYNEELDYFGKLDF